MWPTDDYGYGPEPTAASLGSKLEASMWASGDHKDAVILGYLDGNLTIDTLESWGAVELTEEEALAFASNLDSGAYVHDNGTIATDTVFPLGADPL